MSSSPVTAVIRPEVLALSAYHVPDADGFLKLDAMENPYSLPAELQQALSQHLAAVPMNRYPAPAYTALKKHIRTQFNVPEDLPVVLGNGSDELISMLAVACAKPAAKILAPVPGFVMYAMSAKLAGMEFVGVPLTPDFQLDRDAMLSAIRQHRPAIIYLAYPNNPTGALFDDAVMHDIISASPESIVVVDEAYQPFAQRTWMDQIPRYPQLVVMRTVSKLGLAGIRLGYMTGSPELMTEFEKVRPPYNINVLTEAAACFVLQHAQVLEEQAAELRAQRTILSSALENMAGVQVYPSAANFLLIRVAQAEQVFGKLLQHRILVKNVGKMHPLLENCLRVTVSTREENTRFLAAFAASISS